MASPTVIKSTDVGSPALYRIVSSFIAVLDYCLLSHGWSKVFTGTNGAVYRSNTGQRKFFKVVHEYGTTHTHAVCYAYDSMSSFDSGSGLWATAYLPLIYGGVGTTTAVQWMIIVGTKSVIIATKAAAGTYENCWVSGFGETTPMLPGQTSRCWVCGASASSVSTAYPKSGLGNPTVYNANFGYNTPIAVDRSIDGSRLAIPCGLIVPLSIVGVPYLSTTQVEPAGRESTANYTYPYNGELLCIRPILDDGVDYSLGDYIPGLYYPCQKRSSFNNWTAITDGTKTFMPIYTTSTNVAPISTVTGGLGCCLIDIGYTFE